MPVTERVTNAAGGRTRAVLSNLAYDIQLDVVISFAESQQADVTQHAIQSGADITDNVNNRTEDYTVEAVLTDDDYDILDPTSLTNPTIKERMDYLLLFKNNKQTLTYFGQDQDIENLIISSLTKSRTQETGKGIRLSIGLKKINVATAQSVEAPVTTTKKQNDVNQKGQTPKGTNGKEGLATAEKNQSLMKDIKPERLKDFIVGFFGG